MSDMNIFVYSVNNLGASLSINIKFENYLKYIIVYNLMSPIDKEDAPVFITGDEIGNIF